MGVVACQAAHGSVTLLETRRLHQPDGLMADERRVVNTDRAERDHLWKPVTAATKVQFFGPAESPRPHGHRQRLNGIPATGCRDVLATRSVACSHDTLPIMVGSSSRSGSTLDVLVV